VINFRICVTVAALAFILSFLLGLISRAAFPMLIVRPLIFGAVFFGLAAFINVVVNQFLPELLDDISQSDSEPVTGSRINIMEGDSGEISLDYSAEASAMAVPPVFMGAQPDDSDDVADISTLSSMVKTSPPPAKSPSSDDTILPSWLTEGRISEGMDHTEKMEYNKTEEMADFSKEVKPEVKTARDTSRPRQMEAILDLDEMLPDLDSMVGAFVSDSSNEDEDPKEYSVSTPISRKTPSQVKGGEWAGDFNAQDMAAGLRTVLKKDKEG